MTVTAGSGTVDTMTDERAPRLELSDREAAVAKAYAFEGLSVKDVGAQLGLSPETVKSYLKRARAKYHQRDVDASTQHRLRIALLHDGYEESPTLPE